MASDYEKSYGRIVAKAWSDERFMQQLLEDPAATLRDNGIDVPSGVEVTVVKFPAPQDLPMATPDRFVFALPAAPEAVRISDEQLAKVAGGDAAMLSIPCRCYCHGCVGCNL